MPGVTIGHVRACSGLVRVTSEVGGNVATIERPAVPTRQGHFMTPHQVRAAIPAGHYALLGQDDAWKFYKVDKPTEGRWAGYTFIKVQAGSEYHRLPSRATENNVLGRIAADPKRATIDYGHQLGRCGVCNRTLTNPDSIADGIGPICAAKMGW
jgi:hypothetical protein